MPWQEIETVDLRAEFVEVACSGAIAFSELCRRYCISRKTGYKWLNRFGELGVKGLHDQSRRPKHQPAHTAPEIEALIVACFDRYPGWGPRKLHRVLTDEGHRHLPAHSTISEILRRHDRSSSSAPEPTSWIRFEHPFPNDLWQMDFKGHFPIGNTRCHPLTVLDDCSRFSLCLQACGNERRQTVQEALTTTFRRYGLPRCMTMDNGPPWGAGGGNGRFSRLSVWLIEQGITVGHSRPYHPQTQGKLERFHRTLKSELLGRRQFDSFERCQREFDGWRARYNLERPHEALGMERPAARYECSQRPWLENPPAYEYSAIDEVRKVSPDQCISFHRYVIVVGEGFVGKQVALRPTLTDGKYTLHFCHQQIGEVDLRELTKRVR